MSGAGDLTTVYTDGACVGNPGPGGWAWAVPGGRYASGAEAHTTNQRMEIHAVLEAVLALDGPLEVVSDSTYVVNCFRDRWWEGWLSRGWKNSQRKDVANRDLWQPLIEAYRADPRRLRFRWVKGHATDPMNDLVDRLAVAAARTQHAATGERPPAEVGAPDVVGSGRAEGAAGAAGATSASSASSAGPSPAAPVPEGHRLVVVGHKPPELGGYDENPIAGEVRRRLVEILVYERELEEGLVLLTGLGLGAEQLGAEAAIEAGVPFYAVLAYPDPDSVWPTPTRARFASLRAAAAGVIVLQPKPPATKQAAGAALSRRDAWLYRHADAAIAVWDGRDAVVGRMVRSLEDHLGATEVRVVAPVP